MSARQVAAHPSRDGWAPSEQPSLRRPKVATAAALAEAQRIAAGTTAAALVKAGREPGEAALIVAKRAKIVEICQAEHIRETAFLLPVHRAFARLHTALFSDDPNPGDVRQAMDALAETCGLDPITLDAIPGHLAAFN